MENNFKEAAEKYATVITGAFLHQESMTTKDLSKKSFLAGCEHAAPKTAQDILKDLEEQIENIKTMKYFSDQFKEGYAGAIHDLKVLMRERFSSLNTETKP
jgi:hypothetical protein